MKTWLRSILAGVLLLSAPSVALAQWDTPSRAFHKATAFPLDGRHLAVPCASCHLNGAMKGTPTSCFSCHWERRQDDRYRTRLGSACEQCHNSTSWTSVRWDHAAATGMPLNAAHKTVGCEGCHKNGVFKSAASGCVSCHRKDFEATRTPNHKAAGFSTACESCHRPSDSTFTQARFDHNATFPLVGQHALQDCASCHAGAVYKGTPRDCVGCHRRDYDHSKNPNHAAAGYSTVCDSCHRATDATWQGARVDHNQFFPLVGQHSLQNCAACHLNGVFKGTARDCIGCHRRDYDQSKNPNHAAAGYSTACETCHKATDATWQMAVSGFNHNQFFPLVGQHGLQACQACHINGVYKGTSRDCIGCHRRQYDQTKNPNHAQAGYSTACDGCHKATDPDWLKATFNHSQFFPLVGLHATQACAACHINGVYKGTSRDCVGCHRKQYDQTKNPNHAQAGYSTACDGCHKATDPDWLKATFNHSQFYTLVGLHATQACAACHINGVYKGTPRDCVGCHRKQYDQTKNPSHAAAGYSTACDGCHKATDPDWLKATFNHSQFYALVGLHATQACAACHINGVYKGTPRDCVGCHRKQYDATKNPSHVSAGYSTACDGCHKATDPDWLRATFNHTQFYPLAGKHSTANCTACHINNVYKGTSRTCYPCHKTEYDHTTNPSHVAAGFPTACDNCHKNSDATWTLGKFTHSAFPITSGRHSGNACSACHTNTSNYAVFSCTTGCHDRTTTDAKHKGKSGYQYNSNNCYACHPQGRAG
jgi:hypothetical protein